MNVTIACGGYPVEVPEVLERPTFTTLTVRQAEEIHGGFWRLVTMRHKEHGDAYCYCCGQCDKAFNRKRIETLPCAW